MAVEGAGESVGAGRDGGGDVADPAFDRGDDLLAAFGHHPRDVRNMGTEVLVEALRAGVQHLLEAGEPLVDRGGDLDGFGGDLLVESVEIVPHDVVDVGGALREILDELAAVGLHRAVEFADVARDEIAECRGIAADPFGELGAVVGEHLLERLQALREHVADHVAARGDRVGEPLGVAAEVLGDAVAVRDDAFGDLRARLLELGDHVVAALAQSEDDVLARRPERAVGVFRARREGVGELRGRFDEQLRRRFGACGDRLGELAGAVLHALQQRLGPLREAVDHAVESAGERLLQVGRDLGELVVDRIGLEIHAGGEALARGLDRPGGVVAGALEALQEVGAAFAELLDHGIAGGAERDRDVLALLGERTGDAARRLVDALGDELAHRGDVVGEVEVDVGDGVAHLLGLADQRLALLGEAVEQIADAHLVVVVGALERRHLAVDQRLELGRAGERPLDAVAHRRDLAADRLADGDDRVPRHGVGLGEAQRRLGHRLRDRPQLLRALEHVGEHIEEDHRRADRGGEADE